MQPFLAAEPGSYYGVFGIKIPPLGFTIPHLSFCFFHFLLKQARLTEQQSCINSAVCFSNQLLKDFQPGIGMATRKQTLISTVEKHELDFLASVVAEKMMKECFYLQADVPTVILVCMLSLSTSTLLRMTASRATRMYVRLMSNTIDVPETHTHTRHVTHV